MSSRALWKLRLFHRDHWRCRYCGCSVNARDKSLTEFATVDHVQPRSRGGMSTQENMVTACRGCNEAKGDLTLAEYERAGKPRREYTARRLSAGTALKQGFR